MGPRRGDSIVLTHSSSRGPTFLQFIFKFFESVSLYTAFESPRDAANFLTSEILECSQGSSSRYVQCNDLFDSFYRFKM